MRRGRPRKSYQQNYAEVIHKVIHSAENIVISITNTRFAVKRCVCARLARVEISRHSAICKLMVYWQKCIRIFHIKKRWYFNNTQGYPQFVQLSTCCCGTIKMKFYNKNICRQQGSLSSCVEYISTDTFRVSEKGSAARGHAMGR